MEKGSQWSVRLEKFGGYTFKVFSDQEKENPQSKTVYYYALYKFQENMYHQSRCSYETEQEARCAAIEHISLLEKEG